MLLEDLWELRQAKGYSLHIMAEALGIDVDAYAELEYGVRTASPEELALLTALLQKK